MTKSEIRAFVKSERKEKLTPKKETAIAANVISMKEFAASDTVFIYSALNGEISTEKIIKASFIYGKNVALPVTNDDFSLSFYYIAEGQKLKDGKFGISEPYPVTKAVPTERSLCIVPAFAVSKNGFRVGHGKGCYDRFLSDFAGKTAALVLEDELIDFKQDEHDVRLGFAVTENGIMQF